MGLTVYQWCVATGSWSCIMLQHIKTTSDELFRDNVQESNLLWFQILIAKVLLIIGGIERNPGPGPSEIAHLSEEEMRKKIEQEVRQRIELEMRQRIEQEVKARVEQELRQKMEQEERGSKQNVKKEIEEAKENPEQNDLNQQEKESRRLEHASNVCFYRQGDSSSSQLFSRRAGTADMTGELFEVNVALLLFLRGMFETGGFHLATNVDQAGAFDDLLFIFKDNHAEEGTQTNKEKYICFLQLKTKVSKVIKRNDFSASGGDFSLIKYYTSYYEIQKEFSSQTDSVIFGELFDNCEFIIYTNTKIECEDNWFKISNDRSPDSILYCGGPGGSIFQLKPHSEEANEAFATLNTYKEELQEISEGNFTLVEIRKKLEKFKLTQSKQLLKVHKNEDKFFEMLNDQLLGIGDRDKWEQFLKKLKVYTCQYIEEDLEGVIKQNLEMYCGTSRTGTQAIFDKLSIDMIDWWRKGDYFLTESFAPFWTTILKNHISHLVTPICSKMAGVSRLKFQDTQNVLPQSQVTHIVTQGTTKLTCLKVQQNLACVGHIMIDKNTLQSRLSELLALWGRGLWYNVLVVEGGIDNQDVITGVSDVLHSCPNKQLIIITSEFNELVTKVCDSSRYKMSIDNFSLSQLDDNSQQLIVDYKVNFQGSCVSLKSLAGLDALHSTVTADTVVELLTGDLMIGQKLPDEDDCYISRTLLRKEHVEKDVLTLEGTGHLAITGITLQELQQLVPPGQTVLKFDGSLQPRHYMCQYFVIDSEADFMKLCRLYRTVHWLHKEGNIFIWKKSKGDTNFIRKLASNITYDDWKNIMDQPDQMVLVIAEPGMGKSTELLHLALKIKHIDPTLWVLIVNLNSHIDFLNSDKFDALDLLLKAGNFSSSFERAVFEHVLHHKGNVIVMFDGFDEISPTYANKVINILKNLGTTKVEKVLVTSRLVMRDKLEGELLSLHFNFKPFSLDDQKEYLHKFWKMGHSLFDMNTFIDKLLGLTKRSLNDRLSTFTGIPLQTRMLGEAFQAEAKLFSEEGEMRLPLKLDLLQLYNRFVDRKWEIYYCEKNKVDIRNVGVCGDLLHLRKKFIKYHMNCGLLALLNLDEVKNLHNSEIIIKKYNSFLERFKTGSEKTGIVVDVTNNRAAFVHRTFEEYFVALWFSKNFEYNRNFLEGKNFDPNFQIVRKFFDRILAQKFELHVAVLNQNKILVEILISEQQLDINAKDEGGRTALHLAVMSYIDMDDENDDKHDDNSGCILQQILEILLRHGADPSIEDKVFCWKPLRIADRIGAWAAVDLFLERQVDSSDLVLLRKNMNDDTFLQNLLGVASRKGFMHLIAFVLKSGIHVGYEVTTNIGNQSKMLNEAAEHGQLRLVQFLVEHNADIEEEDSFSQRTPLMVAAYEGHIQVVNYLIQKGASASARNKLGDSAILQAAWRGNVEVFHLLSQCNADLAYNVTNNGDTVLHFASRSGSVDLTKHILETLTVDVNSRNDDEITPLMTATMAGKLQIVQLLCEHGADLNVKDSALGFTPLHLAARIGFLQIVQCLIDHGACPTALSNNQQTPFDLAVKRNMLAVSDFLSSYNERN